MTNEFDSSSEEVATSSPEPLEEIRSSMLGELAGLVASTPEARSFAAVRELHLYLLGRGWVFDSADSLIVWVWPPSRIDDDGYSVLTTDVWVDVEEADAGPESLRVNISLVGERDDGRGEWTGEFPLAGYETFPLEQAEAFRVGAAVPVEWGGGRSPDRVAIPREVAGLLSQLYRPEAAEAWLHGRNSHLAGGRPIDFLKLGHVAAVVYALNVEIQGGMA